MIIIFTAEPSTILWLYFFSCISSVFLCINCCPPHALFSFPCSLQQADVSSPSSSSLKCLSFQFSPSDLTIIFQFCVSPFVSLFLSSGSHRSWVPLLLHSSQAGCSPGRIAVYQPLPVALLLRVPFTSPLPWIPCLLAQHECFCQRSFIYNWGTLHKILELISFVFFFTCSCLLKMN